MMYLLTALVLISSANALDNQTINQTTTTQPNVTIDAHGCITSAGFIYCALREKCIRPWEEPCNDGRTVPLNSTISTTTTLKPAIILIANTTTTTISALPSSSTSSLEMTLASSPTTIQPIPTSVAANATNETNQNIVETTSTTEAPTTTMFPTTTVVTVCGNLYQEPGEECDTTANACGAGRWQCVNCKCVPLPEETTTTTTTTLLASKALSIPSSIDTRVFIGAFAALVILVVLILYFAGGKEDKEEIKKP